MNKIEALAKHLQTLEPQQPDHVLKLQELVNDLIQHDFNRLVQFLYQVDVDENQLKTLLQNQPQTDAAVSITRLLIERQLQKIKRKENFTRDEDIPEDERW